MTLYNEFDANAAAWIGELITAGILPPGGVDARSVALLGPRDLEGVTHAHFFAGIGGWAYALHLAGWPDGQPVWTASLPCQPFSVAGKGLGEADERHLWPVFRELVRQCLPPIIFGEQVASADGRVWLSGVRADLEGMGYAVGGTDLCAAGIGAPHIRQRLYWVAVRVADANQEQRGWGADGKGNEFNGQAPGWIKGDRKPEPYCENGGLADSDKFPCGEGGPFSGGGNSGGNEESRPGFGGGGNAGRLADLHSSGSLPSTHSGVCGGEEGSGPRNGEPERCGEFGGLADGINPGLEGHTGDEHHRNEPGRVGEDATGSAPEGGSLERLGESNGDGREPWRTPAASSGHRGSIDATGGWSDFYLVQCRDGKVRRVGTGLFPLAHGLPRGVVPSGDPDQQEANASQEARKVRLKGYGNAIVPQLAAEFIGAVIDVLGCEKEMR